MTCWNCKQELAADALFCPECETLQPPLPGRDYFQILELPRTFTLAPATLEQAFKRLSRQLHPDRFATASPRVRRLSLEHATALNDANRTLRVPVKRAEYLLELWGRPIGKEDSRSQLPLELMETVMELREQIADAKFEGDQATLSRRLEDVSRQWRDRYASVEALFSQLKTLSDPTQEKSLMDKLEQELHMLRYLQGILTEHGMSPTPATPDR